MVSGDALTSPAALNSARPACRARGLAVLAVATVLGGIGVRLAFVHRPFDHRLLNPWRQSDYFQIARNFHRDGLHILYPRIDWRGDTPGYVEMEFPLLPWIGGVLFGLVGEHAQVLRAVAALLECVTLILFATFAWKLLSPVGAVFATAAFALNPLLTVLASSIQPEPFMHCASLAAVMLLWSWREHGHFATLLAASAALSLAMLAKLPSACLGLLFAFVVVERLGTRALRDWRVLLAASVAVIPSAAWYTWAHQFWTHYGMSLGLSNETHLIGADMFVPPRFLVGIATWETLGVVTPLGWLLVLAALTARSDRLRFVAVWYAAVWVFYLLAGRTTGDSWAYYYHSQSVPPACLLMGMGFAVLWARQLPLHPGAWVARHQRRLGVAIAVTVLVSAAAAAGFLLRRRDGRTDLLAERQCALEFLAHVPVDGQIVLLGGSMYDEYGMPVAHNESMMFAWMDRTGFCYGKEEFSIRLLESIASRGGRYWMVEQREIEAAGLRGEIDRRFARLAACNDRYSLYDLRGSPS